MTISVTDLQGVPETLLFTLYLRYRESIKSDGSIKDERYREIVKKIDFDFEELGDVSDESVLSITFRTLTMDNLTKQFVERNPDGTVVSMASGLDFRHERIDNGKILWFDVELPEVIALRRRLFKESRRLRFIEASVLDSMWMDSIPKANPVLFVAEGLFMYLTEGEVQDVFTRISKNFTNAEMIFDVLSPWWLNIVKCGCHNRFMDRMYKATQWALTSWSELELWDPGIEFIREYKRYLGHLEDEIYQTANEVTKYLDSSLLSVDQRFVNGMISLAEDSFKVGHYRLGSKS